VDLEVKVAADRDRVAGLPDGADSLAGIDAIASRDQRRARHVSVEVGTILAFAVDQQVVAVEDWVIAGSQHGAVAHGDERRVAGGDDVEALVGAAAVAGGAEFPYGAAGAVGTVDRKDVAVIGDSTRGGDQAGGRGCGNGRKKQKR
jgi:hypothetical protein